MKIAAVICVRMTSKRLPRKALCVYDSDGKSNLACIIDRVRSSRHCPEIVVATSKDPSDDPIVRECNSLSVRVYRGDLENVTKRFSESISEIDCDFVWRVMADNPLVDIGLVDWRLDILERTGSDLIRPILPEPTYAAQANVWSKEAWDYCAKNSSGSLLEHPGEYLYENWSQFRTIQEPGPESLYYQPIRTELDTPEDLEFFRRVWSEYPGEISTGTSRRVIDTKGVLAWISGWPDIIAINSHIREKTHTTYLHGHHRARNIKCANEECGYIIGSKVNERIDISCPRCGTVKNFYL